jgi:Fe-S cluster biogenesis protein NfuA/nitrite reductase/ring-hydroxylating ferredoxin subunit
MRPEPVEGRPEPVEGQPDLRATGERIDTLLEASAAGGVVARERAEELVRLVADLYGAGLERVLTILHEGGHLGDDMLAALAADDLVSSLLLVHDLHPYDVPTRVEQALDSVRPYLGSHGGDVELLGVSDDGVVRLRLLGSCDGCASSSVTLKLAVEGAIEAAAPEVVGIEVEMPAESAPVTAGPVISVDSLWSRIGDADRATGPSWQPVPELAELADGEVSQLMAGPVAIVGCRLGTDLFAFLDRCGQCEAALAGATLGRLLGGAMGDGALRCANCSAHFQVRRAGACLERPELHLSPLPLLVDQGLASVAVPVSVAA